MSAEFDRDLEGKRMIPKDWDDLPGQAPQRKDEVILKDIESMLFYDDLVHSYEIAVEVNRGVVTLSGTVSTEMERRRAAEDALKAVGVKEVVNNIQISRQVGS